MTDSIPTKCREERPEAPTWREREEQLERVRSTADKLAAWLAGRRRAGLMAIAVLALIMSSADCII